MTRWLSDNWPAVLTGFVAVVTGAIAVLGVVWKAGQLEQRLSVLETKAYEQEETMHRGFDICIGFMKGNREAIDRWAGMMFEEVGPPAPLP